MFDEFIFFIINLIMCLFYCFQKIQRQYKEIKRLEKRVSMLEETIENLTI
jgi:flagellar biogenesis protein FliO